jgi:hypothetical protein
MINEGEVPSGYLLHDEPGGPLSKEGCENHRPGEFSLSNDLRQSQAGCEMASGFCPLSLCVGVAYHRDRGCWHRKKPGPVDAIQNACRRRRSGISAANDKDRLTQQQVDTRDTAIPSRNVQ